MTTDNKLRHFLTLMDFSSDELRKMTDRSIVLKQMQKAGDIYEPLKNRMLGMIFEKSSTRTRVSFETGMLQFGGGALFLSPRDTQLGRGEPIEDSARVLSQMVDIIMIRTFEHEKLETFMQYSSVPVINALTDMYHPCQLLADMQCYQEHRGSIEGKTVTWIGDGNNMCHSYINAARQWGFKLNIACPEGYDPDQAIFAAAGDQVEIIRDPMAASTDSDLVVTDVWTSMGQEEEQARREAAFDGYIVDDKLMAQANNDALFMHCLPAHRGEEVSASVIDGKQSVVWDEAGNRLHAQKVLLEFLMQKTPD
ncbi:MAG: ornithine carbamoyltransferase [gamma proteobacterium symbiont of Lucinoma myriamae]|nr:ornithine carbamoyltransferase [gamma proteobacterium symbiont of Lucinoma myriamae]MCU7819354.1 ornithine carbamoyltransferase [gamma proteobacterium symbiont of Lucinoma myriamae]MCU7832564.1 ornithine carbamoyltransferase [gamma proteobacterium symbiont of Lucinoma myriamae]